MMCAGWRSGVWKYINAIGPKAGSSFILSASCPYWDVTAALPATNPRPVYYIVRRTEAHQGPRFVGRADLTFTQLRSQIDQINNADWHKVGLWEVFRIRMINPPVD